MLTSSALTQQGVAPTAIPYGAARAHKTIAFTGAAGLGAVGAINLFQTVGAVLVFVVGHCQEDLVEAAPTATIEVGTTATTNAFIAQVNAVNIDNGEIWLDATPGVLEAYTTATMQFVGDDAVIRATVGAQNITDGTIEFVCLWTPISVGARVYAL